MAHRSSMKKHMNPDNKFILVPCDRLDAVEGVILHGEGWQREATIRLNVIGGFLTGTKFALI
jgi:hypothetical protein